MRFGCRDYVPGFFLRAVRQIDERYGDYGTNIEIRAQMKRAAKKVVIPQGVTAIHESAVSPVPAETRADERVSGTAEFRTHRVEKPTLNLLNRRAVFCFPEVAARALFAT